MIYNQPDSNAYGVASFRTLGSAASPQNLFTIENPNGNTKLVVVRFLSVFQDSTAALATVAPTLKLSRPSALPTGGTVLTSVKADTGFPSATAVCRGATASDGGGATAITATAGTTLTQAFIRRLHTAVGIVDSDEIIMLSDNQVYRDCVLLRPNEALLCQLVTAAAATTHFMVNCDWEELEHGASV